MKAVHSHPPHFLAHAEATYNVRFGSWRQRSPTDEELAKLRDAIKNGTYLARCEAVADSMLAEGWIAVGGEN